MKNQLFTRRLFLRRALQTAVGLPFALRFPSVAFPADALPAARVSVPLGTTTGNAKVAMVSCRSYGAGLRPAFNQCFNLLGGLGTLVKNKTVTIKLNLTGTNFGNFFGRPPGETYMTHPATVNALVSALFDAGAKRVKLTESTNSRAALEATLTLADWDVKALTALGTVEFENTRNLGRSKTYAHLPVPGPGYMFSAFDLNRAYADTDVMVSMAKLKNHVTAGVTLSMKNMFGSTPNSIYGEEAGREDATAGRGPLHGQPRSDSLKLPALKENVKSNDPTWRVPRVVADVCAARPIHLAIIDGITAVSGGEGPWCGDHLKMTTPGVLLAGLNPVCTDAVATAVMGYPNPRASRKEKPFDLCDNHILLAEQAGLGTADLSRIDVRGLSIEKARYPYEV